MSLIPSSTPLKKYIYENSVCVICKEPASRSMNLQQTICSTHLSSHENVIGLYSCKSLKTYFYEFLFNLYWNQSSLLLPPDKNFKKRRLDLSFAAWSCFKVNICHSHLAFLRVIFLCKLGAKECVCRHDVAGSWYFNILMTACSQCSLFMSLILIE